MKAFVVVLALLISTGFSLKGEARSSYPFNNLDQIKERLGFSPYYLKAPAKRIKIAVFDRGFDNYKNEIGKTLPKGTQFHPGPLQAPEGSSTPHGTVMAQLVTGLMTNEGAAPSLAPDLHLYNVFGYTNFKAAIDDAIASGVDIILHSEVWDYGSNYDGHGFFNAQVSRATAAGIIWVNAAGNYRLGTYNGSIATGPDYWLAGLPAQNGSALEFRCEENDDHKCSLRLVLSWNDFRDDVNAGTDKDLDLAVFDDIGNVVQTSQLRQTSGDDSNQAGNSKYPREIITTEIKPGEYFIKIKNMSKNFVFGDQFRISASGEDLKFSYGDLNENLSNPADNASVVTVGASDSDRSSVSVKLHKPELAAPSSVVVTQGEEYLGSSNAAAFIVAGFGMLKSMVPSLNRAALLSLTSGATPQSAYLLAGVPTTKLGFKGTGAQGCFNGITNVAVNSVLQSAFAYGATFVQTTAGTKLMVGYDPINLAPNLKRQKPDDIVVATTNGLEIKSRRELANLTTTDVEVFQVPLDIGLCGVTQQHFVGGGVAGMLQSFHLPGVR